MHKTPKGKIGRQVKLRHSTPDQGENAIFNPRQKKLKSGGWLAIMFIRFGIPSGEFHH